ncbi:GLUG motif-containing protein [Bacteroides sp. 51]|uniref:GLUG motif-containing protein n=1 Tax=Bacteroides sp. 51 TaxID=2302938 RepID=UPI0013D3CA59|nr:GLUG motif-containing protein [Bacteroides sp. 51]NDV80571.1 hypothetical protein [Bacteroides sp. 51]
MKKNKQLIPFLILALSIILPVACTNNDLEVEKPQTGDKVTIRANIAQPAETRMSYTDIGTFGAEKIEVKWEVGDEIVVYDEMDANSKATFKIENSTDISSDGKSATFTAIGDVPEMEYGGRAYFAEDPTAYGATYFPVPDSQSANDTKVLTGKKLPMMARGVFVNSSITFEHMAYILKFSFRLPEGAENPAMVTLKTDETALQSINGLGTKTHDFTLEGYDFGGQVANFDVYIPLFPSPNPLGNLTVTLKDASSNTIGEFVAATNSTDAAFKAGKMYTAKIAFNADPDQSGSLVKTSTFNADIANMTDFSGIDFEGDGYDEEYPYIISSATLLRKLIVETLDGETYEDCYFKLTTDIHITDDIQWTPIGHDGGDFYGNFDGSGHTISGTLNLNNNDAGFFGYIYDYDYPITIKNLTIAANIVANGLEDIGGIIGTTAFSPNVTIDNCHFSGNITDAENYVGGIIGSADSEIKNCTSRGTISSSSDYCGGICGYSATITSCKNYAKVTSGGKNIGGIAGGTISSIISACENFGNINGTNQIGGIVGYCQS